jgi:hypothetical protein
MLFSTEHEKIAIFPWKKSSVFNSTAGSSDSSQARYLGALTINVLIYAGKRKPETDLRKMIKFMEEFLKIEKNEEISFSHAQPSEKRNKKQKRHFMNSVRLYFCVPTYEGHLQGSIPLSMTSCL